MAHALARRTRQADVFSAAPAAHSNEVHMAAIVNPVARPDHGIDREPTLDIEIQVHDENFGTPLPERIHKPAWNSPLPVIFEVENEVESFEHPLPQRFDAPLAMIPENGDLDATGLNPSFRQSPDVLTLQDRSISRAHSQDHPHDSPNDR